jgi:hypothetical protein
MDTTIDIRNKYAGIGTGWYRGDEWTLFKLELLNCLENIHGDIDEIILFNLHFLKFSITIWINI